jgi:S1-C subfamily serine protease
VLVALVLVIAFLAFRLGSVSGAADAEGASPTPTPTPTATAPTVEQMYQKVGPSVVLITTANDLGTGVVVDDSGTILTANHVVAGEGAITVEFADGTKTAAAITSSDPKTDIATLVPAKLPSPLVPATLGGSVAVGAPVVAIGNPLGLTDSVSSGVVAGLNRMAQTDNGSFSGLIQFDASINPGSSGGPLLDASGSVVGVVVSIADPGHDDAWAGIGFAVPIGAALGGGQSGQGPGGPRI